jgi:RNA polymerase sigma-70 factor, ECF subfamily
LVIGDDCLYEERSFARLPAESALNRPVTSTPALGSTVTTSDDLVRLLARVAQRDREAFAQLYAATSAKLYGVILRILRRRDLADEILQEVYIKIWEHAGSFVPDRASPVSWMAAIARNRALDEVRRKTPLALEDMPAGFEVADTLPLASETVERTQELQRLFNCLDGLDPQKAEIVKLAYLNGLSRDELASRFGHPAATIKTWLHRSLKQLKDCLGS